MTEKRIGEIRLHTDQDGQIWGQRHGEEPCVLSSNPDNLASQSWLRDAGKIRIIACGENAALIVALHSVRCHDGRPRQVQLGNPRLLPSQPKRVSTVFGRMDAWDVAPSLGGWRELTNKDYVTYALMGVLHESSGKLNNLAERLLRAHPAWPAVSFLSDANVEAACHLVCTILDPRWHVDPAKPDARKRLLSLFGLGHSGRRNIGYLLGVEKQPGPDVEYAKLVLDTWTGGDYTPPRADAIDANHFLWRIAAKGEGGVKGMVRSCQVFLTFLHDVWLDNLTPMRQYEPVSRKLGKKDPTTVNYIRLVKSSCYSPQLFVPEHFFELPAEIRAWRQHTERLRQRAK